MKIHENVFPFDQKNLLLSSTRMLIHGYGQNGRSDFNRDVKNALLAQGDHNVIVGNVQ
jgi:hypothetical protein